MSKLVVIISCHLTAQKCAGYACMQSFYTKTGKFAGYPHDTQYLKFTCGGCCGATCASKLEDLIHKLNRDKLFSKNDVVVHLASCVCSDNYHRPPCPHLDYIKAIVERKGFQVVLGTYISKGATKKREAGIYQSFE